MLQNPYANCTDFEEHRPQDAHIASVLHFLASEFGLKIAYAVGFAGLAGTHHVESLITMFGSIADTGIGSVAGREDMRIDTVFATSEPFVQTLACLLYANCSADDASLVFGQQQSSVRMFCECLEE